MEEIKAILLEILAGQKEHTEQIESLRKRIDELHDPVLTAFLEQAIQVRMPNSPIQELLTNAKKEKQLNEIRTIL